MNKRKLAVSAILCTAVIFNSFAIDFGLVINQQPVAGNRIAVEDEYVEYTGTFQPWISGAMGEQFEFYAAGGLTVKYERELALLPSASRGVIVYRPIPDLILQAGRFTFADPLGFVFSGPGDGLGAAWNIKGTRLNAGVFYTGLQYKKDGHILMNASDLINFHDREEYFASRRLVTSANWTIPSVFNSRSQLDLGLLAQVDFNDTVDELHSQYLLVQWSRPLGAGWYLELGLAAGAEEQTDGAGFGFAFSGASFWVPHYRSLDRVFINLRVASGNWSDEVRAFKPVTTEAQGRIVRAKLSGLSFIEAGYIINLQRKLEAELSTAWFFRTDMETFRDSGLDPKSEEAFLGGELYTGVSWIPESWCSLNVGAGFFVPPAGTYNAETGIKWRVTSSVILSF